MKKLRFAVMLAMVSVMLLNTVSVFAADRDIWKASPLVKHAERLEFAKKKAIRLEVAKKTNDYYFELGGKLYKMADANRLFRENPDDFLTKLAALTPAAEVPGDDLQIIGIE